MLNLKSLSNWWPVSHLFIKSLTQKFINKLLCGIYTGKIYLKNFKELKTWNYYFGDKDNKGIVQKSLHIAKYEDYIIRLCCNNE